MRSVHERRIRSGSDIYGWRGTQTKRTKFFKETMVSANIATCLLPLKATAFHWSDLVLTRAMLRWILYFRPHFHNITTRLS
jgi:hypothetical protein